MSGRRVKRGGETNSALIHQLLTKIAAIPSVIWSIDGVGTNGTITTVHFSSSLSVAFSDTNGAFNYTFYVENGGSFKVSIIHVGTGANAGKTASGIIFIQFDVDGGLETWNIGTQDFNLPLEDDRYLQIEQFGTAFTVANNSKVGVTWAKDDNAGGAAGIMHVYGMILVRQ